VEGVEVGVAGVEAGVCYRVVDYVDGKELGPVQAFG